MKRQRGFTLLEIVVTVALIALIFSVVTANFHRMFASSRLESAARGLGDHFAFSISRSYTTGSYHTLLFDLEKGTYLVKTGREDEEEPREILNGSLGKGIGFTDIQVDSETYTSPGTLQMEISPLGMTNDLLVNLEDIEGKRFALSLNSLIQSIKYYNEHMTFEEIQEESQPQ